MTIALITLALIGISFISAWLTIQVRSGGAWWLPVLGGIASYLCWAVATKWTVVNLVVLSAWFDVVVALVWFVAFWWLGGESIALTQWVGIVLLCVGLALVNLR